MHFDSGYIKTNPVIGTRPYKRQKPVVTVLGKEKIKVLLKAACEGGWYLEILLALFCGLRKGEIMGLKYEDYDKAEHTISISRQISTKYKISERSEFAIDQYELVEKEPKTENSYRTLRVPDVIAEEIEIRRKQRSVDKEKYGERYFDKGYISCQPNGRLHSLTALNNALTKICSRNSLPHITVHGLRHMYATILLEMGVPLVKISALLGHGSIHTTFEYYCEMMDENEKILAFMNNTFVPEMEEEG